MKSILFLLSILLIPFLGYSTTWEDPYFEDATQEADLICIGVVETSSLEKTTIRITKIFKGEIKPEESVTILRSAIVGHGHEEDKLTEGEKFFFMVKKQKNNYVAFTDTYWNFSVNDSLISIPIRDPLAYISVNREHFETFLSLLIEDGATEKIQSFVDRQLKELTSLDPLTKTLREVEIQMFTLEVLYYFGNAKYSSQIVRFLNSPYYHVRWSCVRALSTCGGTEGVNAILSHLENEENAQVQSVLGKAVFNLNIEEAKSVLLKQIPKVSSEEVHLASDIMNPVFNTLPAPRYSYGAALMKLNGIKGNYDDLLSKSKEYIVNNPNIVLDILENKKTYYSIESAMKSPDSVFILVLGREELTELPIEIKEFKNLKSLSIYRNKVKQLPDFITELGLIELDLSNNELTTIPDAVYKCSTLKRINLQSNEIKEIDPRLFNMTELEEINLGSNSIAYIPNEIGKLVNLKKLNLRMNDLDSLPEGIEDLKELEEIELYGNDFHKFPEILIKCHSIKTVQIGSNSIKRLPENVKEMKSVKYIDLSYNPLSSKERENISKLPARIIVNTETYQDRFYSIYEAVENNDISAIIHDSHNDYSDFQLDLSVLKTTTSLVFTYNHLTTFPPGMTKLNTLKTLVLHHNSLTEIPEDINKMTSLNRLDLSYNKLTRLPSAINELPLKYLNLKGNNISDSEKELIKSWFNEDCKIIW